MFSYGTKQKQYPPPGFGRFEVAADNRARESQMDNEELQALIAPAVEIEETTPAREPQAESGAKQPPLTEKETVGFYKAMQEERDRRQAAEKRIAELEARREPVEPPTQDQMVEARLRSVTLTASRKFADREYGKELLAEVHDWAVAKCDADPHFNASMMSDDDPYEKAVQAYNREQIAAEVQSPDDLAQFKAWKAAQAAAPQAQATPKPAEPPIPKSLADAPGNGAAGAPYVNVGGGEAFGSFFKG